MADLDFISTSRVGSGRGFLPSESSTQGLMRVIFFSQVYCCISMVIQSPELCACHTSREISWVVWHQGSASNKIAKSERCKERKKKKSALRCYLGWAGLADQELIPLFTLPNASQNYCKLVWYWDSTQALYTPLTLASSADAKIQVPMAQALLACISLSACSVQTNRKRLALSQPPFPFFYRLAFSVKINKCHSSSLLLWYVV